MRIKTDVRAGGMKKMDKWEKIFGGYGFKD